MRVLLLTNIPSPYRVDFFNLLGREVNLKVMYERRFADDRERSWLKKDAQTFKEIYLSGVKVGADASVGIECLKYISKRDFDLLGILGYSSPTSIIAITYCRLMKIPYFLSSDGAFMKPDPLWRAKLKGFLVGGAQAWLSTGRHTSEYLQNYGARTERTFIYPFSSLLGANIRQNRLTEIEKEALKHEISIPEEKIVIAVGRFIPSKGFDVLLKAGQYIGKGVGIYIVGGDPIPDYLKLKNDLKLENVHFISFMNAEELAKYYQAADVFVLPTREDIWGLVINEAMTYGLPVITTDRCGAGLELIENGINGYLVAANDQAALAAAINKLLDDDELRGIMAAANMSKIKKYTLETMAERHLEIFNTILVS